MNQAKCHPGKKIAHDPRIWAIQAHQDEIRRLINITLYNMREIDTGRGFADYMVLIKDTGKWTTHKALLYRRLLVRLRKKRKEVRLALLENMAGKTKRRSRLAAINVIKNAEKRGYLTPDEEEKVIRHAEKAIQIVAQNRSRNNIRARWGIRAN